MKKVKEFLNTTSEISNGKRLCIMECTLGLMAIGMIRNYQCTKAEHDGCLKDMTINALKDDNAKLRNLLTGEDEKHWGRY